MPHCRVLIILGLDVLGQADIVGNPLEYDKVAAGMIAQPPAGGPAHYMNGRGGSLQPACSTSAHLAQCCCTQAALDAGAQMVTQTVTLESV